MSWIENRISGYWYNEGFINESNEEKCTAFQSMAWSLVVHKYAIKNSAQLLYKHFLSDLSLCIIYFPFHEGKDTSAISRPSVQHLVYVFPIFFRFRKCFNNCLLSKNILINIFFHWNMCFFIVLPP